MKEPLLISPQQMWKRWKIYTFGRNIQYFSIFYKNPVKKLTNLLEWINLMHSKNNRLKEMTSKYMKFNRNGIQLSFSNGCTVWWIGIICNITIHRMWKKRWEKWIHRNERTDKQKREWHIRAWGKTHDETLRTVCTKRRLSCNRHT